MKYFLAKVSKKFLAITYILAAFIIGVPLIITINLSRVDFYAEATFGFISFIGFLIFFITRLFVANGFEFSDRELIIRRYVRSIHIPLVEIKEIISEKPLDILKRALTLRLMADGGLWGAHGVFYNKNIGKFYMYVTNMDNIVDIIRQDGRHFFISPDPKDKFVEELKSLVVL